MMADAHYYYDGKSDCVIVEKLVRPTTPSAIDNQFVMTIDARDCDGASDSIEYDYGDIANTVHVVSSPQFFAPVRRVPWTFSNRFAVKRHGGFIKTSYNARGIKSSESARKIAESILDDYAWGAERYTITQHDVDGVVIPGTMVAFIGDYDGLLCEEKPLDIQSVRYDFDGVIHRCVTLGAPKIQGIAQRLTQAEEIAYPMGMDAMRFATEAPSPEPPGNPTGTTSESGQTNENPWADIEDDGSSQPTDTWLWKDESHFMGTSGEVEGSGAAAVFIIESINGEVLNCRAKDINMGGTVDIYMPFVLRRNTGSVSYPNGDEISFSADGIQQRTATDGETEETHRVTPMFHVGEYILAVKPNQSMNWIECGGGRSWAVI